MTKKRAIAVGLVLVPAIAAVAGRWVAFDENQAPRTNRQERSSSANREASLEPRRMDAGREGSGTTQEPHPITPMHEVMAERREVIGALRSALQERHYDQARLLLGEADALARTATDDSAFGGAVRGYRLILACLAARAEATDGSSGVPPELLEESQKYLTEQRLSPRREVRRVCLEGRPFARRT